jgi:hypothetical protein
MSFGTRGWYGDATNYRTNYLNHKYFTILKINHFLKNDTHFLSLLLPEMLSSWAHDTKPSSIECCYICVESLLKFRKE